MLELIFSDENIRILMQVPIHLLLVVTFYGMRSLNWGRFCKIMFCITLAHVLILHLIINPRIIEFLLGYDKITIIGKSDIAAFGAIIAGASGSVFAFLNVFPKHAISYNAQTKILISLAVVIFMLLIETILNLRVQYLFNNEHLRGSLTHMIFKWVVLTSTISQLIAFIPGGYDGFWNNTNHNYFHWFNGLRTISNTKESHKQLRKGNEEL